jgi:hypothetical protein
MSESGSESDAEVLNSVRSGLRRPVYYRRDGQPATLREWAAMREDPTQCIVALDEWDTYRVITKCLGVDEDPFVPGPPLIFGTAVFLNGAMLDEQCTATEDQARDVHYRFVELLRRQ